MASTKKKADRAPTLTPEELAIQADIDKLKGKDDEQSKHAVKELRAKARRLAFQRLAPKRTRKALSALANIEALGDYPVEEAEAEKIVGALRGAVDKVAEAFRPKAKKAAEEFEL